MLLKLHRYLNWADKKLHSVFFIENKDQITEDLLSDFKEDSSGMVVRHGSNAQPKQTKAAEQKPKGLK
jgi:hypothetical protein